MRFSLGFVKDWSYSTCSYSAKRAAASGVLEVLNQYARPSKVLERRASLSRLGRRLSWRSRASNPNGVRGVSQPDQPSASIAARRPLDRWTQISNPAFAKRCS